jgi:hypothetical protein
MRFQTNQRPASIKIVDLMLTFAALVAAGFVVFKYSSGIIDGALKLFGIVVVYYVLLTAAAVPVAIMEDRKQKRELDRYLSGSDDK